MAHAEEIAASLGYERVYLYTNERFTENIIFYHGLGYRVEREEGIGDRTIKVDMSKTLRLEPRKV